MAKKTIYKSAIVVERWYGVTYLAPVESPLEARAENLFVVTLLLSLHTSLPIFVQLHTQIPF